ncbi:ureidoglycolate lyase [Ancylobacter sonchi]|nr:ureidoglycolate lyase [Ancylobacter sonchi]
MRVLVPEPLDAATFAPFGQVMAFDPAAARRVNDGWAQRADLAAVLDAGGWQGPPQLAVFRAHHQPLPAAIGFVERHPASSQVFMPLAPVGFLVVVAPAAADGGPDLDAARAFLGAPGQGVNYRRGTWHAPITATDADTDFLMLIWERGTPDDCVVVRLSAPLVVQPRPADGAALEETPHGA